MKAGMTSLVTSNFDLIPRFGLSKALKTELCEITRRPSLNTETSKTVSPIFKTPICVTIGRFLLSSLALAPFLL